MGIRATADLRGLQDSEDCRASKVTDEAVIGCFSPSSLRTPPHPVFVALQVKKGSKVLRVFMGIRVLEEMMMSVLIIASPSLELRDQLV